MQSVWNELQYACTNSLVQICIVMHMECIIILVANKQQAKLLSFSVQLLVSLEMSILLLASWVVEVGFEPLMPSKLSGVECTKGKPWWIVKEINMLWLIFVTNGSGSDHLHVYDKKMSILVKTPIYKKQSIHAEPHGDTRSQQAEDESDEREHGRA